jgi:hypothetical protein
MSYYNTNVVFDRNGTVISRYRKFNLFDEQNDKPFKPQLATFQTDFGVKFGHFICFDIMFREPALRLTQTQNVTDIIFTSMWFSQLPFLTAVQVQQSWAFSNDVNLLAANANNPKLRSTGSGIYAGRKGTLVSEMNFSKKVKIYSAEIPKKNFPGNENYKIKHRLNRHSKHEMKELNLRTENLSNYDVKFLNDSEDMHLKVKKFCKKNVCCDFIIEYEIFKSSIPHYQYAIAFYSGDRTFDGVVGGDIVVCAILACQSKNISTCGMRNEELENIHIWQHIEIKGSFKNAENLFFSPTTLDTSILPLESEQFTYIKNSHHKRTEINLKLTANADNLLTFGIFGRSF